MKKQKPSKIMIGLLAASISSSALAAGAGCPNQTNADAAYTAAINSAQSAVNQSTKPGGYLPQAPDLSSCIGGLSGFSLSFLGGSMPSFDSVCSALRSGIQSKISSVTSPLTSNISSMSGGMVTGSLNNSGNLSGNFSGYGQNGSVSTPTSSLFY